MTARHEPVAALGVVEVLVEWLEQGTWLVLLPGQVMLWRRGGDYDDLIMMFGLTAMFGFGLFGMFRRKAPFLYPEGLLHQVPGPEVCCPISVKQHLCTTENPTLHFCNRALPLRI